MKKCSNCKTIKNEDDFGKNASHKDGLQNECKKCKNARNKEYFKTEKGISILREWYRKNFGSRRAYNYKQIKKNPEKYRETSRKSAQKYREAHPDYVLSWQRANADKIRAIKNAYRTRKAGNGGSFTDKEWKDLCDKYGNKCLCCGKKTKLAADHVIPVAKGGTSNIDNIQPLCRSCNSRKHTKDTDYRKFFENDILTIKE